MRDWTTSAFIGNTNVAAQTTEDSRAVTRRTSRAIVSVRDRRSKIES